MAIASGVVVILAAASLIAYAVAANGYPVRHVNLNDGGIWVTSNKDSAIGRLNKPAGSLDAAFNPPQNATANDVDVFQSGDTVLALDRSKLKLYPVDVHLAKAVEAQAISVAATDQIVLEGSTLAVLDPGTGDIHAQRLDPTTGLANLVALDPKTRLASFGPPASAGATAADAITVGADGTVYAASASGKLITIRPAKVGFAAAVTTSISEQLQSVQLTAVGNKLVVFDAKSGLLLLPDGKTVTIPESSGAVLQQPSAAEADVAIATRTSLVTVSLASHAVNSLWNSANGAPAAPAWLNGCLHSAWGNAGSYVKACNGKPAQPASYANAAALQAPAFRVNRDQLVLNDLQTGAVFDPDSNKQVDDWSQALPPPENKQSDQSKNTNPASATNPLPPKAVDETFGARPGRTTVLNLLDFDSDPAGLILSIDAVVPSSGLTIAPDGQSVALTVAAGQASDLSFSYTIDDGAGQSATGNVTVHMRTPDENEPPVTRNLPAGAQAQTWAVAAGGTLSLPIIGDWRDYKDGDPVTLGQSTVPANAGSVTSTPDGRINYIAPTTPGTYQISYNVSDGRLSTPGTISVVVYSRADPKAKIAATPEPDVARGQVGQPIVIHPLDNDLPGSDPSNPNATLTLAGIVAGRDGIAVVTDLKLGTVTATATRKGSYVLSYTAAFGNAPFANPGGQIRVDVVDPPSSPLPPVAMPDTAVLYGQLPTTVDVLANDFDPAGNVLVVQHATETGSNPTLEVAIVAGHWLRIKGLSAQNGGAAPIIDYTITDGISTATGQVVVTRLAALAQDAPVPQPDFAVVRAGDSVLAPVLDNDTDPGGDPISLAPVVAAANLTAGQLTVSSDTGATTSLGSAYVSGNFVRYIAPASVTAVQNVTVTYVAQTPSLETATGQLHVTIEPAPVPVTNDQPPSPQAVEARVIAGDQIVIPIPTSGVDPDGDSVAVSGLGSPATLGRVTAFDASSITYEAYPTTTGFGTDSFSYIVTDRWGKTGTASVRVAVVPPGDAQPPVAVDDTITAAPNATLNVDVFANDLRAPDDTVTIEPLDKTNPDLAAGIKLVAATGPISVTAPAKAGSRLVVVYGLTDGATPSTASLTVNVQDKYNNPPVAADVVAKPTANATSVKVNLLAKDSDPENTPLTIVSVGDPKATIDGDSATVPVTNAPQTIAYVIKDVDGATAAAVIHVPAVGAGAPFGKGGTISIDKNATKTVSITDYAEDPAGKPLRLTTTEQTFASPTGMVKVAPDGLGQLVLTSSGDYTGPAGITFQVTDGTTLTDGLSAYITVPVQVGPATPVLRCPSAPIDLVEGGATRGLDIAALCHVWVADPATLGSLQFTGTWSKDPGGVSIGGAGTHTLSVTAAGNSVPGSTGTLSVGVAGTNAIASPLTVAVVKAPAPSLSPITLDGFSHGATARINLSGSVTSQLRDPAISIVSLTKTSGADAASSFSGSTATITPGGASEGTIVFAVVVTDVADKPRTDRQVSGTITMHVLNVPHAPTGLAVGLTVQSKTVSLSWTAPADDGGAPIDRYEVDYSSGSGSGNQICAASPCDIVNLTNGAKYTFTVKAHNAQDFGPTSGSAAATPDKVPNAVTGLAVSKPEDGALNIAWTAPVGEGSAVTQYQINWAGGGSTTVPGSTTATTLTGLINDNKYTFTVTAVNQLGPGASATIDGQSAGVPATPGAPVTTFQNDADRTTRDVLVSWAAVDPNGIGPTLYTVMFFYHNPGKGGGTTLPAALCTNVQVTSCAANGITNSGDIYTYTVIAANQAALTEPATHTSPAGPSTSMEATAQPDAITNLTATATGTDGQATLNFTRGDPHGTNWNIDCTANGVTCGDGNFGGGWSNANTFTPPGAAPDSIVVAGLVNGANSNILLSECNEAGQCSGTTGVNVVAYGPMNGLAVNASPSGITVSWSVSVNPNGKAAAVTISNNHGWSQNYTTGTGAWSTNGADNVGYSTNDTINVTVSDPGRTTLNGSNGTSTGVQPPPPVNVTVSWSGVAPKANCQGDTTCTYLNLSASGLSPGNHTVTWYDSAPDNGPWLTQTISIGANGTGSLPVNQRWFAFGGHNYLVWAVIDGNMSNQISSQNNPQG